MSAQRKHVSSMRFTKNQKQKLIEYLCRDCKPVKGGDYHSDLSRDDDEDCGEYLDHGEYAQFMTRFVDLLNKDTERHYRIPRMDVRRLWEENALPKCQMADICRYVIFGLETDRLPEDEKAYSGHLSDTRDQLGSVIKEYRVLRYLLQQEQALAEQKFRFSHHNDELNSIVSLAKGCLKAALEIRKIRRANFSVLTRKHELFAARKLACYLMLNPAHENRGGARLVEISHILPVLHEAIDGRFPDVSRYDVENLRAEAKSLQEESTKKRLRELEKTVETISPAALDIRNESWRNAPKNPKTAPHSIHYSVVLSLSNFLQDYLKSPSKEDFADNLEDRLRLFVQIGTLSKDRHS